MLASNLDHREHPRAGRSPSFNMRTNTEQEARNLKAALRPRLADQEPRPCDRCRRSRNRCDKQHPCQRCVKAGENCTYDDVTILRGRMSRQQKERFAQSGMEYVTFRERLKRNRLGKTSAAAPSDSLGADGKDHGTQEGTTCALVNLCTASNSGVASTKAGQKEAQVPAPLDIDHMIEMIISGASDESIITAHSELSATCPSPLPLAHQHAGMISVEKMPKRAPVSRALRAEARTVGRATILYGRPTPLNRLAGDPPYYQFPVDMKQGSWSFHSCLPPTSEEQAVLFFGIDGAIHEEEDQFYEKEVKEQFKTDWSCRGPGTYVTSPPWRKAREGTPPEPRIWPVGSYAEDDYDWLRQEAARILADPITPILLEIHFFVTKGHGCVQSSTVLPTLLTSCDPLPATAPISLRARQRFQQAFFLLRCISACVFVGSLMFDFGRTAVPVNMWRYAFELYRIAWALCHPRRDTFQSDELCLDLLSATMLVYTPGAAHPLWSKFRRIPDFTDVDLTRQIMLETSGDADRREVYKRVLSMRMLYRNMHRLWHDRGTRTAQSYTSILKPLGPIRPWPDHDPERFPEANQVSDRWTDRHFALSVDLALDVVEPFFDSPLTQPPRQDVDATLNDSAKEAAALQLFDLA